MNRYIVATIKEWNINAFHRNVALLPDEWILVTNQVELKKALQENQKPEYIFFPHWSWIVHQDIINNYNCVCFHIQMEIELLKAHNYRLLNFPPLAKVGFMLIVIHIF